MVSVCERYGAGELAPNALPSAWSERTIRKTCLIGGSAPAGVLGVLGVVAFGFELFGALVAGLLGDDVLEAGVEDALAVLADVAVLGL